MQYRLFLIMLLVLAFISPMAVHGSDAVTLTIGGEKPFLHVSPVLVDDTVYATLPVLGTLGARYFADMTQKQDGQKVVITAANGDEVTCFAKLVDNELMIPIQDIASKLGAVVDWHPASMRLSLRARITNISFDGSELHISASYPVAAKVTWWGSVNKLILDMNGVYMPPRAGNLSTSNTTNVPIRSAVQSDGQTGRVVLDLPRRIKWRMKSPSKSSEIIVSISGLAEAQASASATNATLSATEAQPMDSAQQTPGVSSVTIRGVGYSKQGARRVDVFIDASGPAKYQTSLARDPDELTVEVQNALLDSEIADIDVGHEILQSIRAEQVGDKVRVIMGLNRIVGFDVKKDERSGRISVSLVLPKGADGLLAGKTIVIDPGHGGKATGAKGLDGSYEKDSNLAIAKRIKQRLLDAGVCAVLTRDMDCCLASDTKADLEQRVACAARHSADAFLSIHSNSVSGPRCPTGLETYYHGYDMSGKALAYCVHSEIVHAGLLPDLRVRSDFMLYQTGLGVLRSSSERYGIPAVLIEVGYVRHPDDLAKLRDPKFHDKVAESVVRGLKAYFEGNPSQTRRSIVQPVSKREEKPAPQKIETLRVATEQPVKPISTKPEKPDSAGGPNRPGER